jgi:ribonuclease P/MRP protein subunit POP1
MHYPLSTGGNPRFGGLDEQRQVAFEQGRAWFPGDFPATDAGVAWELHNRGKLKSAWDRRPKSKRVEWESLDLGGGRRGEVGDGMACDFEYLFGIPRGSDPSTQTSGSSTNDPDAMKVGHGAGEGDQRSKASAPHPLSALTQVTKASFEDFTSAPKTGTAPKHSIATVSLTFIGRGVADPCARIYRLPTLSSLPAPSSSPAEVPATGPPPTNPEVLPCDLREQWLSKLPLQANKGNRGRGQQKGKGFSAPPRMPPGVDAATRTRLLAESLLLGGWTSDQRGEVGQMNVGSHPLCPGKQDLMGFVTTGSYCLREGKATAIGSISVERALEAVKGSRPKEGKLCIVRNAGENVGWLARWEVI